MPEGKHQQIAHQILREGFAVSCQIYQDLVVVSARAHRALQLDNGSQPALPSHARIVVWGNGGGQLRDRLREPTPWTRLRSWLRRVPFPSREAQLEALTDELLAAIGDAPSGGDWTEHGEAVRLPQSPIRLPGERLPGVDQDRHFWAPALGALIVTAVLALAAIPVLRSIGASDAAAMPLKPVELSAPTDDASSLPNTIDPPTETTAEAGDASPSTTIDEASSAAEIVLPPDAAGTETPTAEYVVQAGDVLTRIAAEHAIDLDDLLRANALDAGPPIQPGQVLRIP